MGSRVKKPIYVSKEEQQRNQMIIDAVKSKFVKKTYKAQCTFKKTGSTQEYVATGRFVDEDDAQRSFNAELDALRSVCNSWKIVSIEHLNPNEIEEDTENE